MKCLNARDMPKARERAEGKDPDMQVLFQLKKKRRIAAALCSFVMFTALPAEVFSEDAGAESAAGQADAKEEAVEISDADAAKIEDMEEESSELQDDLAEINQELLDLGGQIADVEEQIDTSSGQIAMLKEQLSIAKNMEKEQYADMKLRIQYMYENGDESFLQFVCTAEGMGDFLNRIDFVQNVCEYDRAKLEDLRTLQQTIAEQDEALASEQEAQKELEEQLTAQQEELNQKAKETSTDLEAMAARIEQMKEEAEKKAAEEAQRAAREAEEKKKAEEAAASQEAAQTASASSYNMPSGSGVLTKYKGVNYFNGHKETYYSQRVLPGGGLQIPGRHVAEDGTIRDADGYICVASSDYPKGTVVETSLGPGKVYDTGCAKGTIDLYTDW